MSEYIIQKLGRSKAGHDKGKVFVIVGEEPDGMLLADGKNRTLQNPKRKNPLHVQPITHPEAELKEKLAAIREDRDVREVLRLYEHNYGGNACRKVT